MNFDKAYNEMKNHDKRIKLPDWEGYWYYSKEFKRVVSVNLEDDSHIVVSDSFVKTQFCIPNNNWLCLHNQENDRYTLFDFYGAMLQMKQGKNMARQSTFTELNSNGNIKRMTFYQYIHGKLYKKIFDFDIETGYICKNLIKSSYDPTPEEIMAKDYKDIGNTDILKTFDKNGFFMEDKNE